MKDIPTIPKEYLGKTTTPGGYTNTAPRKWTEEEINWCIDLKNKGFTNAEIAASVGRSEVSIQIKLKRITKKNNTYNAAHVTEKYEINNKFVDYIKPNTVLDLYCGEKDFYKEFDRVTNDKNEQIPATYHMDAFKCICMLYSQNKTFDLIDLDPYGSAFDSFDLAIKMAKKGLVITLGEMGHKRWKRLDYVKNTYDIERLEDFTIDKLIAHIQKIGRRNKKELIVFDCKEWRNIGRVWFEIAPYKELSQWEKREPPQDKKEV